MHCLDCLKTVNFVSASFEKRNNADMSDITSGKRYRNMTTELLWKWIITLTLNTDGVSVFRTSRTGSLWPVYLTINELPPECRFSLKYAIVCALWLHPSKPPRQAFLQLLMSQLKELSTNGETFKTAEGLQHCKVILIFITCDLPARAMILCMKQHNGQYACPYCYNPGVTIGSDHLHQYWPIKHDAIARTHASVVSDVTEAVDLRHPVKGMLNVVSPLLALPGFDIVDGTAIDWMHVVYLGITRSLLDRWPTFSDEIYSIGDKVTFLDKRLLSIKAPDHFSRIPHTLKEFSTWKGSENRSWLFFWSLPVLRGILPREHYIHYSILVVGCRLLCGMKISSNDIDRARQLLLKFYERHELLYAALTGSTPATFCH
ncbi:uncharacterized protein LOC134183600 [Corticium candelabrum]|uniref:uncharacterized protein LOC134183600 n=1 Tax=Corticium candelabrum TaxID=121492 RepID=UPI002E26A10D|nr:uncharacterized protein LOC134183600 [Corticium candelabrum]